MRRPRRGEDVHEGKPALHFCAKCTPVAPATIFKHQRCLIKMLARVLLKERHEQCGNLHLPRPDGPPAEAVTAFHQGCLGQQKGRRGQRHGPPHGSGHDPAPRTTAGRKTAHRTQQALSRPHAPTITIPLLMVTPRPRRAAQAALLLCPPEAAANRQPGPKVQPGAQQWRRILHIAQRLLKQPFATPLNKRKKRLAREVLQGSHARCSNIPSHHPDRRVVAVVPPLLPGCLPRHPGRRGREARLQDSGSGCRPDEKPPLRPAATGWTQSLLSIYTPP